MKNEIKLLALILICFSTLPVNAQDDLSRFVKTQEEIDKNTRHENRVSKKDVFADKKADGPGELVLPKEENCFVINNIILEDDFLQDRKLNKLLSQADGQCVGSEGIRVLATYVQDYIINAGYVTTRVEVPDQDLSTKQLRLRIAAGKINKILITGGNVRQWILPFNQGDILNLRDIEQGLEVLQRIPGVDVKINIAPDEKINYSDIVINMAPGKKWNLRTWMNSWGDKSTGKVLAGVAGYLYNQARMNDIFYTSVSSDASRGDGSYKNVSVYYSVPWGYWDYELFFSNSKTSQGLNIEKYKFNYVGKNRYLSFKGARTFYRDQNKKLSASVELIKRDVAYRLDDIELALQKRDMFNTKLALRYKQNFPGAMLDGALSYQRFVPWLGAKYTPDMASGDVSQQSHIINLDVNYIKLFNIKSLNGYYDMKFSAQYSPDALTLQDQFSIGNRWSVRGFEYSGGLNGNKGFYVQNNVNFATGIPGLEWYAGVDYGQIAGAAKGAYSDNKLMGAATGFKGNIKSFSYDVSLSTPLLYPDELEVDKATASFNVSWQL
ncbi:MULTISPECIES: ShlB/FhaC/HecB family hemolysin secretion/activation protein [Tenebrionibacter/Tenebrionicola group]|jgi:hemolysin activation/secretion protein|uniref:ShlB/FhaC/HecB family hemolysin secretion/activation protein n=2 Tax=Tenebrionibacter/Tenebrionicola group TaxID=2969848 RepID=A0A8K0V6U7_9ENTR|nr:MULTISPECIES: ShlB/FhaC/HecB family hemolysin secretion/activation protein [Tenebrionibacter/Tenebrionicola group]MBK4715272.1 ShlB/FhaC/HecB family hemolysin secretion/activation protein [Tenebrionibacter intestinalis]MBV5096018.1 ShlB/FhaC/HecB family hemolysin secretion/activation protein [Tenebrionicola larvae]